MVKTIIIFAIACLCSGRVSFAQQTIIHDPNAESRVVGNFSAVRVSGGVDLYLSQGNEDGVAVSAANEKIRERIKTNVEKGILQIWYQGSGMNYSSGNKKMTAYVSFKSLRGVSASGSSDIYANGTIKGEELRIQLSGASDFKGVVETNKLNISQSGASDASISGKASNVEVDVSGASKFKGYDFETENCFAKASGASDVQITVNKELNANASGASSIYYKGNGVVKGVRSNGASKVKKM
ncbi:MAG: head GIN domain-containing protein [Chitinophagaceae bacterium]